MCSTFFMLPDCSLGSSEVGLQLSFLLGPGLLGRSMCGQQSSSLPSPGLLHSVKGSLIGLFLGQYTVGYIVQLSTLTC